MNAPDLQLVDISRGSRLVAKVIDFGVSSSTLAAVGRKVDCPVWLAPEIIRGEEYSIKSGMCHCAQAEEERIIGVLF